MIRQVKRLINAIMRKARKISLPDFFSRSIQGPPLIRIPEQKRRLPSEGFSTGYHKAAELATGKGCRTVSFLPGRWKEGR